MATAWDLNSDLSTVMADIITSQNAMANDRMHKQIICITNDLW